jgi:hypothetical protein
MKAARWICVFGLALGPALAGASPVTSLASPLAEDVIEISITELTQVEWSPGKKLPKKIAELDGKKVRIKGFMALETEQGTSSFRLTYDQCGCSNAKASHFVDVDLGDEETDYGPEEFTLEGVFSVGEKKEDGFVTSLYRLKADSID